LLLRKANVDPSRVLLQISWEVKEDLTIKVKPIRILNQSGKKIKK
jgi:hypothetical protein